MLNSDFDHMFGLANGFCDQKPERSEMNWPIGIPTVTVMTGRSNPFDSD